MQDDARARHCLNCGTRLGEARYCPSCGQAARLRRITLRETVGDFLGSALALEGPYFETLRRVVFHPGELFRDYLAGRRVRYYKPVSFFIVNTAVYLLLSALIGYDPLAGTRIQLTVQNEVAAPELTAQAARFMVAHINHILLFLVLSLGLLARLLFRKRYNLAEYIAVAFFVVGFYIAFGTVLMLLSHNLSPFLRYANFVVLIAYVTAVYPAFLEDRRLRTRAKAFVLAVAGLFVYTLIGFGFSFLVVWLRS